MKQKFIDFLNILQTLRQTIVMLLLLLVGVWFRLRNYITGDNFVELLKTTTISYMGVHGLEHFTSMVKDHLASKNNGLMVDNSSEKAVPVEVDKDDATDESDNK